MLILRTASRLTNTLQTWGFEMATPIIVFFHGLFILNGGVLPQAVEIVKEQMAALKSSGLEDAASEIYIGINGGDESAAFAEMLPKKAAVMFHGLQCRNENRTIQSIESRVMGGDDFYACYFHTKGAQFPPGDDFRTRWRRRMTHHVITEWRKCVAAMDSGVEACGCHYLTPEQYPGLVGHPYFGGNFWWGTSSFLRTLPPIIESPAVAQHGVDAFESRYEAESWIGHGPRRPRIKDFHAGWPG